MATGLSLHIALNTVSPDAYGGWDGRLTACEFDGEDMLAIATAQGLKGKKLFGAEATREAVLNELNAASRTLKAGDLFLITYSGHGGQVRDKNHDERDNMDETWCLYDGQLIDDELYEVWSKFAANTRVLVLSDSCHSGTVTRFAPGIGGVQPVYTGVTDAHPASLVPRGMPLEIVSRAYRARQRLYDDLQSEKPKGENDVEASVLLISGCQDVQTSMDGPFNGAFTAALLRVWNEGSFKGSYRTFHRNVQRRLPPTQQPNLSLLGNGKHFVTQRPFTI
jgi:metacaspase-1